MKKPTKISQKLKKPKLPFKLKRGKRPEEKVTAALKDVPRITSDTVEEHREEVLSSARKYIYPLQHSKHSVVRISIALLVTVVVVFFVACGLALYKFQSTNGFIYGVTKVVPFPAAKAGSHWVSYESYLFELRRNMHYYHTQQHANFSTAGGEKQLERLKQQAMDAAIQNAYVNQLAKQHGVTVSGGAVNDEIALLRAQNRLGNSDRVLQEVLSEFWGWSENDFKRELHQQLLQQAVVAKLDTSANQRAQAALNQLEQGADFAKLAAQVSDDTATRAAGGQYAAPITANDRSLPPALTVQLAKLKPGQVSGIINTGYTLEIVKVANNNNGTIQAAHIQFRFKPITDYTKALRQREPVHKYIKV
ncbi:MAG TPA: peptidylprolyl isomerase [Candidatus Saccharimonadales bacterium]|nr:peptidylprolyl isomerase [Candidatus Saccharimonadales bacterium]